MGAERAARAKARTSFTTDSTLLPSSSGTNATIAPIWGRVVCWVARDWTHCASWTFSVVSTAASVNTTFAGEMVAVAEDAGTTEGKQEGAGAGVVEQQQQPFRPALPHLVLVLDPKRQVVASLNYPAACGFASHEILRLIDAMQNSYYNEVGSVAPSVKKRRLRPPYQPTRTTLRALPHSIVCRSTRR